jgi:septal ring factor EnvC (AmiA/AmiB activator)
LLERKKQRLTDSSGRDRRQAQGAAREIDSLRRDEQRLTRLIEGLIRIAAARKPKAKGRKPEQTRPGAQGAALKNHDPGNVGGAFAALRGRLRLPVKGASPAASAAPRPEGGANWKGVFIRAAEGTEVKAVAGGTVVFSDWLRGFGNLLVIDHGDDFLSVYGNNESLLAAVGAGVKNGRTCRHRGKQRWQPGVGFIL